MILTKNIEISISSSNIRHFSSFNYKELKIGNKILISTDHLCKGSRSIITSRCDICEVERNITYRDYLKTYKKYSFYTCSKCAVIKAQMTNVEKYNDKDYCNKEKIKKTNLKKYGCVNPFQNDKIKDKIKKDNLSKYGVENPMQISDFFEKQQKNCFLLKKHDKTDLNYRGTYEKDFLDFCFDNNIKIKKGKRFEYVIDDKKHYYFSDFYHESTNFIIEIKSDWTYNNNLEINLIKEKATINNGYNYLFIIDKDYSEFINIIKNN